MMSKVINLAGWLLQSIVILLPMVGPILRPNDHYLLRYYAAINRVAQPVMHRVFVLLRPQNGMTIKELLFAIPDYSNGKYRKNFNVGERSILDINGPSEGFDITFLYKLIQLICGLADTSDARWGVPGSLENSLKRIKDHRNSLAHEDISFTSDELVEKIRDLEELCRKVLVAAGLRRRAIIFADIAEMEKGMEEVLLGGIDLWEPYKDALDKLRQEQTSVLLREARKDITKLAKNLRILNPFSWLLDSKYSHLDVEHIFTELEISDGGKKIELHESLTTKLSTNELPDTIVISGAPGIGKTSLVRFLVHDWLSPNPTVLGMENIDLVLPVELRHVFSHDVKDLLKHGILHGLSQYLEIDDVISALGNISLLWLLDGYDEAKGKTKEVIKEILNKFPNSRIVITTRTEFTSEIEVCLNQMHRCNLSIDLKGFDIDSIKNCARNLIFASIHDCSNRNIALKGFIEFLNKKIQLEESSIFSVPLFVTIIVMLWLESPDKLSFIKTRSALYSLLVDHIVNKLMVRDSYIQLNQRKFQLGKKINQFLDALGKMLFKNNFVFSLKQYEVDCLDDICTELQIPFTDTMSAFFVCAERSTPTGVEEKYTIIHRSLMDFLIARAFCNEMISKDWDLMKTADDWFISTRKTLLEYEPENLQLMSKYKLDNLTKDVPTDIFNKIREYKFFVSIDDIFQINYCSNCSLTDGNFRCDFEEHNKRIEFLRLNNLWFHMKNHVDGWATELVVGYLNIRQQLTEVRCEQLAFFYFSFDRKVFCHYSKYVMLVNEADNNLFNKALFKYVSNFTWVLKSDRVEFAKELLNFVAPKSIFIHWCYNSASLYHFHHVIHDPSEILISFIRILMEHPLEIHLDLTYFFSRFEQGITITKTCLELLLKENFTQCRLITVRCPVDIEILQLLKDAIHLRELIVKLHGKDLLELAKLIKVLPDLEVLSLVLDPGTYAGLELPVLIPENRKISMDFIVLIEVFNVDFGPIVSDIKRLSPNPCKVVLQGSVNSLNPYTVSTCLDSILMNIKDLKMLVIMFNNSSLILMRNEGIILRNNLQLLREKYIKCTIKCKSYRRDSSLEV